MSIYMNSEGGYYAADKARGFSDMLIPFPSDKLVALLEQQGTVIKGAEVTEVFNREKDAPGFIMQFVEAAADKPADKLE